MRASLGFTLISCFCGCAGVGSRASGFLHFLHIHGSGRRLTDLPFSPYKHCAAVCLPTTLLFAPYMYSAEARPVPQNPWHHFFSPNAAPAHPERVEGHNDEEGDHHANRSQRQAASEPYGGSMRASSSSQSTALSSSPAAMFLSAFVAAPQPALKPDDEGQVISGYTLGPIVGYGASSIIRKATSSSGGVSAVKIIRRSDLVKAGNAPHARRRLQHEASVWAMLSHEHILPLFSAVHTPYADYFFTLLCPAGTLFDILQRDGTPALLQDDAGMMFRQVVRGLRYLHEEARYVHRDMKLENVLVDEMGVCKIGDFGMTRRIDSGNGASTNATVSESEEEDELDQQQASLNDLFHPVVQRAVSLTVPSNRKTARTHSSVVHPTDHNRFPGGVSRFNTVSARHRNSTNSTTASLPSLTFQPGSLPYAAPELLLPHTSENLKPHPCQDIWALGVMLYALLTGKLPFNDSFEPRLQMKILNGESCDSVTYLFYNRADPNTFLYRSVRCAKRHRPRRRTDLTGLPRTDYREPLDNRHGGRSGLGCWMGCRRR